MAISTYFKVLLLLLGLIFSNASTVESESQSSTTSTKSSTTEISTTSNLTTSTHSSITATVTSTSTSTTPAPATSTSILPSVAPGVLGYNYIGCYNETTGLAAAGFVRALSENGNMVGQ
jgi:hypothetical protein